MHFNNVEPPQGGFFMFDSTEVIYSIILDRFHPNAENLPIIPVQQSSLQPDQHYGGHILGVLQQLPYLKQLGITSLLFNPFFQNNPESYHGYAIEHFYRCDTRYGSVEDWKKCVRVAHEMGFKIYLDVVLNHTGNNWSYEMMYPIFKKGRQYTFGKWRYDDLPQPSSLRSIECYSRKGSIVDWEDLEAQYSGDIFELKDLQTDLTTKGGRANLSTMVDVYVYWFTLLNVEGCRLDAVKHIHPEWVNEWISAIRRHMKSLGKSTFTVFGEYISSNYDPYPSINMDAYFDFPLHFIWRAPSSSPIKKEIYFPDRLQAIRFLDNHDQVGLFPKQRVSCMWNTRQIPLLWALICLSPGIPCIYYGSEQGLRGQGNHDGYIREPMFSFIPGHIGIYHSTSSIPYIRLQSLLKLRNTWSDWISLMYTSCKLDLNNQMWEIEWKSTSASIHIILNLSDCSRNISIENRIFHSRNRENIVYLYDGEEWGTTTIGMLTEVPPYHLCWIFLNYEKY